MSVGQPSQSQRCIMACIGTWASGGGTPVSLGWYGIVYVMASGMAVIFFFLAEPETTPHSPLQESSNQVLFQQ